MNRRIKNMLEKIKEVMAEAINVDPADVVPEARLAEDLDIDSLAAVELSLELEQEFDIRIEDEELAELKTVQDILDLIEKKQNN
ncbi:acyl carrier protein [Catenisphaera adipataccumulans]|nr:acyl carrier protein [Catenisphaera adipataccumulans]